MTDHILDSSLNVLKVLNQLKDVQPVQSGTFRQFNTLTFTFKHSGQGLEKKHHCLYERQWVYGSENH